MILTIGVGGEGLLYRLSVNRSVLLLILILFSFSFSFPIVGKVVSDGGKFFFITQNKRYEIGMSRWDAVKYEGLTLDVEDPKISGDRIFFSKYRILKDASLSGLSSSFKEILSEKLKKINLDFNVYVEKNFLYFSLLVINSSQGAIKLKFPSSQEVDFVVMDSELKKTIWRWSWGKKFKVGYVNEILLPKGQLRFYARWNFEKSYIEDGEYKVFAELHALPHGFISEVKSIILKTPSTYYEIEESFIPLGVNYVWKYRGKGGGEILMRVTGTSEISGRKYFVVDNFPDGKNRDGSRFIRFNPDVKNFVEYVCGVGEVPLFGGKFKVIESEKGGVYEFLKFNGRGWNKKYEFKRGIGIVKAFLSGDVYRLESVDFNVGEFKKGTGENVSSDVNYNLFLKEEGGYEKKDVYYSLWGNGTIVVMKGNRLIFQGRIRRDKFLVLIKKIFEMGFLELKDYYGKNSVPFPLVVEIGISGKKKKRVLVKTSKSDKPPISFWDILDLIKKFIKEESGYNEK